jgi:cytosine/adenosine deaminase-related metal-dependent hydrolase
MRTAFKARYIFPVASPPVEDGVVTVEAGRIVGIGREAVGCRATELGNVAILPGLINAHTHLEFSGLQTPLGTPGMSLPDWIRLVVAYRRRLPLPFASIDLEKGASECRSTGTVALGEITTTDKVPVKGLDPPPLRGEWRRRLRGGLRYFTVIFREVIGLKRELIESRLAVANKYLADSAAQTWRPGLSPHAPYSVHPRLFDGLLASASEHRVPVALHLAETLEELDLLASGGGPFRKLLIELGAWDETAIPRGARPIDYLRRLSQSGAHALVIHGNYLDDDEIKLVAAHADRLTVVYCPRTHAYFGHARHPLPRLLAAGANVALGTDSRASNPDLNLLEEIRFVARHFPELPPNTALELVTLRAARALQLEERVGSIEPGKQAALVSVPLPNSDATDPHWLVYESNQTAKPLL